MYIIQILIQCPDGFSEVPPYELESTELIVEDQVSRMLVELFGIVIVEDVFIGFFPSKQEQSDSLPSDA